MENKINIEKNENFNDFYVNNNFKRNNSQKTIKAKYSIPETTTIKNFENFNGGIKQYSKNIIYRKDKNFKDFAKSESLYMLVKKLDNVSGCSGFGYYKVIDRSKKEYFCKITNTYNEESFYIDEINNQYTVSKYDNIAKLTDAYSEQIFQNKNLTNKYYIFTEYYPNGELLEYANNNKINNKNIYKIMKQVIDSVYVCHKNGISHRDIKLENFVLDKYDNVKLIDFGFSTTLEEDNRSCGTMYYASPELSTGEKYNCKKNDIYSLGIVLYSINYSRFPKFRLKDKIYDKKTTVNDINLKIYLNTLLKNIFVDEEYRITIENVIKSDLYKYLNEKNI